MPNWPLALPRPSSSRSGGRLAVRGTLAVLLAAACRREAAPSAPATPGPPPSAARPAGSPAPPSDPVLAFTDAGPASGLVRPSVSGSREKRYILEANGPGLCAFDYDGDGDEDLYVVDGQTLDGSERGRSTLYRNRGDGTFEDATAGSGTGEDGWGFACAVADVDRDGNLDLYVGCWGRDRLYRNRGDGSFEDIGGPAGVSDPMWSQAASFSDFDRDSFPDLYVANYVVFDDRTKVEPLDRPGYAGLAGLFVGPRTLAAEPDRLYRNRGDGTFEDVSLQTGILAPEPSYGLAVLFADLDGDRWPDIYVANDSLANHFFRSRGNGSFAEEGLARGLALRGDGETQASMGIAPGDPDGDGREDLVVTNFSEDTNTFYRNDGTGWVDETDASGLGPPSWNMLAWGTFFLDADNDGALDLFVANGHVFPQVETQGSHLSYAQEDQLYRGRGDGRFTLVRAGDLGLVRALGRGAVAADFDRDGRLDIATTRLHAPPGYYRNRSATRGAWVAPRLEGRDCSRDALGAVATVALPSRPARRTVFSGGTYASQSQLRLHFGLGDTSGPVAVEVVWPCGRRERFTVAPASFPTLVEGEGEPLP